MNEHEIVEKYRAKILESARAVTGIEPRADADLVITATDPDASGESHAEFRFERAGFIYTIKGLTVVPCDDLVVPEDVVHVEIQTPRERFASGPEFKIIKAAISATLFWEPRGLFNNAIGQLREMAAAAAAARFGRDRESVNDYILSQVSLAVVQIGFDLIRTRYDDRKYMDRLFTGDFMPTFDKIESVEDRIRETGLVLQMHPEEN